MTWHMRHLTPEPAVPAFRISGRFPHRGGIGAIARGGARSGRALAEGRIVPFFQPQISLATGAVTGAEALARLRRARGEILPPDRFLPQAAREGRLTELDEAVLGGALDALARWRVLGLDLPRVSVNASAAAIRDEAFADRLLLAAEMRDLSPSDIAVEIVESTLIETDDDAAIRTVRRLARAGVAVELDDFGSGHAAFANLIRLELSAVKIDRSIVAGLMRDARSETVLAAVVRVARDLGLATIAEGVETLEQLAALGALGCTAAQGYLIARPMPAEETTPWLAAPSPVFSRLEERARLSA